MTSQLGLEAKTNVWIALCLLMILFFVRGVCYICLLPPGEMWDESSHLAYVDYWAEHGLPAIFGQSRVDPAFLLAASKLPPPTEAHFGRGYFSFWVSGPPSSALPSYGLYEAQHPFLYYALAAPIYRICGGRSNLPAAFSALRLIDLILGTAAFALVLQWLRANIGGPSSVLLGAWVTLQPLILLDIVRIANDALAFFMGTLIFVVAFNLHRPGIRIRSLVLALLLPVAILSKITDAALLPVVIVSLGIACKKGLPVRSAIMSGAFIMFVTLLLLSPYLLFNLRTFGIITPMAEAVANRSAGRSAFMAWKLVPLGQWPVWAASWWVINGLWVGGWSFLWPPRLFEIVYALLLTVAGIATVSRWKLLGLPKQANWSIICLLVCVQITMMAHAAESFAAEGHAMTNSWYAAVAVPWLLILLGSGGLQIGSRRLRYLVMLGVPVLFVVTEFYGIFHLMLPAYYAASARSHVCMVRMASIHPMLFGPVTFFSCTLLSLCLLSAILWQFREQTRK